MPELGLAGFIFFSLASMFGVFSSLCVFQEIAEVNRKLPDEKQISYWGWYPGKFYTVRDEFKRLYPKSRLEFWRKTFQILMIVCMGFVAIAATFLMRKWRLIHGENVFPPINYYWHRSKAVARLSNGLAEVAINRGLSAYGMILCRRHR
jgi:hypothetical protein